MRRILFVSGVNGSMAVTLKSLVRHFRATRAHYRDGSVAQCVEASTLAKAIEAAAMATHPIYKKHSHQRRLSHEVLKATSEKLLLRINEIQQASTFEALHEIVASCAVAGFGEVAIYDTTHRLAMRLNKPPTAVYLHAGTRKGAEGLNRNFMKDKLDLSKGILQMSELPSQLQQLSPTEVEDFLCVYKKHLLEGSAPSDGLEPSGAGCEPPQPRNSRY